MQYSDYIDAKSTGCGSDLNKNDYHLWVASFKIHEKLQCPNKNTFHEEAKTNTYLHILPSVRNNVLNVNSLHWNIF